MSLALLLTGILRVEFTLNNYNPVLQHSTISGLCTVMALMKLILAMVLVVVLAGAAAPEQVVPATLTAPPGGSDEEKYQAGAEFNNNLVSDLSP